MIRKMAHVSRTMMTCLAFSALATAALPAAASIVVHTSDFIATESRTNFNGFEGLTTTIYTSPSYTENGIQVEHVGAFGDVWTRLPENTGRLYFEGDRSWYTMSTNAHLSYNGYERIVLASGASFESIGFLAGSGFDYSCSWDCDEFQPFLSLHYELLNDGVSVASGELAHKNNAHYVGFSGGGFDEVRIWDSAIGAWPGQSAVALDSIEVVAAAVPEPASAMLLLAGLGAMAAARRQRRVAR